jgi:O-antigen/teichoic acid export membrane protein
MVLTLQLLCAYACFRAILPLLSQVLTTRGEERFVANNMMLAAILLPIAFVIASRWGITGIALAWICVHPLIAYRLCDRALASMALSFRDFTRESLWPALSCCGVMAVVVLCVRFGSPNSIDVRWRLATEVLLGGVAYTGVTYLRYGNRISELKTLILSLKKGDI